MRNQCVQTVFRATMLIGMLLVTGCGEHQTSSGQPAQTQEAVSTKPDPVLMALEAQAGVSFPTNAVLLHSSDGGNRDANSAYFEWGLFSPTPIKMPPMPASVVKDGYVPMPLNDTAKFVQRFTGKLKIEQPDAALYSVWTTNGFGFNGTILRCLNGDYLVIRRASAN